MWWYFGGFTALQIIIWVVFLIINKKKMKVTKENTKIADKEAKVFKLYQEIEVMLDSFDQYLREVHEELEENRTALNELSRQATVIYMQTIDAKPVQHSATPVQTPEPDDKPKVYSQYAPLPSKTEELAAKVEEAKNLKNSRLSTKDRETLSKLSSKAQKVRFLMSRGLSIDEVAYETDIGKGEIRLITDLDR